MSEPANGYDPDVPNEVGSILFHDDSGEMHRGLLIRSADPQATPVRVELIDEVLQDEYAFIVQISPSIAHFFGAIQHAERGGNVPAPVLMASNLLWWTSIRVATLEWKELLRERDG